MKDPISLSAQILLVWKGYIKNSYNYSKVWFRDGGRVHNNNAFFLKQHSNPGHAGPFPVVSAHNPINPTSPTTATMANANRGPTSPSVTAIELIPSVTNPENLPSLPDIPPIQVCIYVK